MAPHPEKRNTREVGWQDLVQKVERTGPQAIKKERTQPPLKSPQAGERKRKRKQSQEPEGPSNPALFQPLRKQRRTSPAVKDTSGQGLTGGVNNNKTNPIEYWSEEGYWPKEYFNQDDQTTKHFKKYNGIPWVMGLDYLLARKKSSPGGKQSEASTATPSSATASDEKPRETRGTPYKHASYETILATKGSFINKIDKDIKKASSSLCQTLLYSEQTYPQNSLFRDDLFDTTCQNICNRNEAMVVRDISQLIVPSAQTLALYGATTLDCLIESVSEGWNSAEPFCGPSPQPDYSVGFGRSAFTDDQLEKLKPFVGEVPNAFTSHFMATWQIYFPFLTCEVKCGAVGLNIADRQNAHSMTLAVRGVIGLFKLAKREKELDRNILAFSISHDHRTVRIYGHYPVIDGNKTTFYRYPIKTFDFTSEAGKDKWTSYRFTKNVYDIWMPTHLKKICSVIDTLLPDLDIVSSRETGSEGSGPLQELESHNLSGISNQDTTSLLEEADSQSSCVADVAPEASVSQRMD
ncbi:uncharacterized protein BP5553_03456 [Venustampulla echinocandica]|uniref:DUF7924 domain-containing protein n=1 Tax=Venustampulla echinocandica TaxID=2656787 RepID=A0A370TUC0_9HELO|nr:uncharacterized protein BP5553_03456 [Venustampulla echinocandica]RDL39116.1 hypothetical protein BP5553_03456 [Venustampulla echinocandica]